MTLSNDITSKLYSSSMLPDVLDTVTYDELIDSKYITFELSDTASETLKSLKFEDTDEAVLVLAGITSKNAIEKVIEPVVGYSLINTLSQFNKTYTYGLKIDGNKMKAGTIIRTDIGSLPEAVYGKRLFVRTDATNIRHVLVKTPKKVTEIVNVVDTNTDPDAISYWGHIAKADTQKMALTSLKTIFDKSLLELSETDVSLEGPPSLSHFNIACYSWNGGYVHEGTGTLWSKNSYREVTGQKKLIWYPEVGEPYDVLYNDDTKIYTEVLPETLRHVDGVGVYIIGTVQSGTNPLPVIEELQFEYEDRISSGTITSGQLLQENALFTVPDTDEDYSILTYCTDVVETQDGENAPVTTADAEFDMVIGYEHSEGPITVEMVLTPGQEVVIAERQDKIEEVQVYMTMNDIDDPTTSSELMHIDYSYATYSIDYNKVILKNITSTEDITFKIVIRY